MNRILISLILFSSALFALDNDSQKPINVSASQQSVDGIKNISIFTGDVIVTQGSRKLQADKVTIKKILTKSSSNKDFFLINAYGNPAVYSDEDESGLKRVGKAKHIEWDQQKHTLIMIGKAELIHGSNSVTGNKIVYNTITKNSQAFGSKDSKVITIYVPSENKKK